MFVLFRNQHTDAIEIVEMDHSELADAIREFHPAHPDFVFLGACQEFADAAWRAASWHCAVEFQLAH